MGEGSEGKRREGEGREKEEIGWGREGKARGSREKVDGRGKGREDM